MLIEETIRPGDKIPLVEFSGNAGDCGRDYASFVLRNYPGEKAYLSQAMSEWSDIDKEVKVLFKQHAPHILEIYRGMLDTLREHCFEPVPVAAELAAGEDCTSFAAAAAHGIDNAPLSGQNKDTDINSMDRYIVLCMRLNDGPGILVLAYPGELLGYGMWSNGNTLFRNDLKSSAGGTRGLSMVQFGLLALACSRVEEMVELALRYGITGSGNLLLSDNAGNSVSVEFNAGGVSFVRPDNGILVHANHPEGEKTRLFEDYPDLAEATNSRYRRAELQRLICGCSGFFDRSKAFELLADHSRYPRGICRHVIGDREDKCTTAAIVAEPAKACLSVTKGPPCLGKPVTYYF